MAAVVGTSLEAADVEEAESLLRRGGAPSTIRPTGSGAAFRFDARAEGDGVLTLARYDLAGSWVLRAQPDRFVVTGSDTADLRWEQRGQRGSLAGASTQFGPGSNAVHLDGVAEVFEFQFTPAGLHRLAADAYGVEHVSLGAGTSTLRDPAHAQYWAAVMRYARHVLDGGLLRNEHLRAALKANLAVTMLEGFGLAEATREWRLSPAGALAAYRKAVAFIEAAATRPISALDVARTTGLPLRLLDEHFRVQAGHSVAHALRTARVIGAHTQLVRAVPNRRAAAAIVRHWGFSSLETYLPLHRRYYPGRPLPVEQD